MSKSKRAGKRGRLSNIDLLPSDARPHVVDAIAALKEGARTQEDIREELNNHLLSLGYAPVSKSGFNRKALYIAAVGQDLLHAREVTAIMVEKLDEMPESDVGMLLTETLKTLVYDIVMEQQISGESMSIDMLAKCSIAVQRLERAKKISVDTAAKIKKDFAKKTAKAIDMAGEKAGWSAAEIKQIRNEVIGLVTP